MPKGRSCLFGALTIMVGANLFAITPDQMRRDSLRFHNVPSTVAIEGTMTAESSKVQIRGNMYVEPPLQPVRPTRPSLAPRDTLIDWNHPKNYINIYEITKDADTLPVYLAWENRDLGRDRSVNRDVDVDSKILVRFDRQWLIENFDRMQMEISMSGKIRDRDIEVPGYSQIGYPVAVSRSGMTVSGVLSGFVYTWGMVYNITGDYLDTVENRASLRTGNRISLRQLQDRWNELYELYDLQAKRLNRSSLEDSLLQLSGHQYDSLAMVHKLVELQEKIRVDSAKYAEFGSDQKISQEIDSIRNEVERIRADNLFKMSVLTEYVPTARRRLLDMWPIIETGLVSLVNKDSLAGLQLVSEKAGRTPPMLNAIISSIRSWVDSLQSKSLDLDDQELMTLQSMNDESGAAYFYSLEQHIETKNDSIKSVVRKKLFRQMDLLTLIREQFGDLGDGIRKLASTEYGTYGALNAATKAAIVAMLKDTEILLAKEQAKAGEEVVLQITNGADIARLHRSFIIRLKLGEFGLRKRLTDSFLFLYRKHTPDVLPSPTGDTIPRAVNYEPAPGLTLSWTWYIRDTDRRGLGSLTKVVRFLTPGFGLNVSFPRFGNKLSTLSGSTVIYEESERDLGVSVGPVLTFFDGALQFTNGWMLSSVREKREYFGVGFSFVKGLGKVKSATD